YIAFGAFGRNRDADPAPPFLMDHPPVKRVELAYEAITPMLSIEQAVGHTTLRGYGGAAVKKRVPSRWEGGRAVPAHPVSPAWRGGLEFRSAGNAPAPPDGVATRALDWALRGKWVETEWFGAVDVRVAKPFGFAGSDNPDGETEVWTPYLWTWGPY